MRRSGIAFCSRRAERRSDAARARRRRSTTARGALSVSLKCVWGRFCPPPSFLRCFAVSPEHRRSAEAPAPRWSAAAYSALALFRLGLSVLPFGGSIVHRRGSRARCRRHVRSVDSAQVVCTPTEIAEIGPASRWILFCVFPRKLCGQPLSIGHHVGAAQPPLARRSTATRPWLYSIARDRPGDRQNARPFDRPTDPQPPDRQIARPKSDRLTDRPTNRPTDRPTSRERERERDARRSVEAGRALDAAQAARAQAKRPRRPGGAGRLERLERRGVSQRARLVRGRCRYFGRRALAADVPRGTVGVRGGDLAEPLV